MRSTGVPVRARMPTTRNGGKIDDAVAARLQAAVVTLAGIPAQMFDVRHRSRG
jgi:hypothetical protein